MSRFMFVYRNRPENLAKLSPEQMQKQLQKWQVWIGEGLRDGWMTDPGDGLMKEGRLVDGKNVVADGPFVEAKEIIGGFSIVEASDVDSAAKVARGCPVLAVGGTVEVRPLAGYVVKGEVAGPQVAATAKRG